MSVKYDEGLSALRVLKTFIAAQLATDHAATFTPYGGADCVLEDDEPQSSDQIGRPYVMLALESDDRSTWSSAARPRNEVVARADVMASDFSGAQTGAANPEGSDSLLSKALIKIIETGEGELEALGIKRPAIRSEREVIESSEAGELHSNPHRIRFTYFKTV